jgi:hypothetical protein
LLSKDFTEPIIGVLEDVQTFIPVENSVVTGLKF